LEAFTHARHSKVNENPALLVYPAILAGQRHTIQHHAIEQLGIGRDILEFRLFKECLGYPIESILFRLHAIVERKSVLRIHLNPPSSKLMPVHIAAPTGLSVEIACLPE
jgi:hypothetical protein